MTYEQIIEKLKHLGLNVPKQELNKTRIKKEKNQSSVER